jgi:hypothetical protein
VRYALRRRTRRARYALEDLGYLTRRRARQVAGGAGGWWSGLTSRTRRLILGLIGTVVLVIAMALLVVPILPCWVPGGDECQPEDEAIALVPGDTEAYAHVVTDPDSQQYERAASLAERLPTVTEQLIARLPGPSGASFDYQREVAPWLGGEAALALVPSGAGAAKRAVLLEVGDTEGADRFVERLAGGDPRTETYEDIELRLKGRLAVGTVDGFVVAGPEEQVKRVIDTRAKGRSLEEDDAADEVLDALPDLRLAELYVSEQGVDNLLAPGGSLGSFEAFVNAKATLGAGAALTAGEDNLELALRSVLDEERFDNTPGFFGAFPRFDPDLTGEVSEGSLAYLALGDPARSIVALLTQATAEAPGIVAGVEDVGERLRKAGKVDLEKQVLPLLTSQAVVTVEPGQPERGGARGAPEAEAQGGGGGGAVPPTPEAAAVPTVPYVSLILQEVDEEKATKALARLQRPIAKALDPSVSLQAPVFKEQAIDGVTARSLRISRTVDLTYALVDGKLVVATDPLGVRQVQGSDSSLEESDRFEGATEGFPDELSALAYLNLKGLLGLAEQAGLGQDPAYGLFADELRKLEGLGVAVEQEDERIDTEIRLTVTE